MSRKYTIVVRAKINGSRKAVTGRSSYDSRPYNQKFKDAITNAAFEHYSKNLRKKNLTYDNVEIEDYQLVSYAIAYMGDKASRKKAPRGRNAKLKKQILDENKRKEDKPISKKEQQRQLYGKKRKLQRKKRRKIQRR